MKRHYFNLEELGPLLPGDEKTVAQDIVSDSVQNILLAATVRSR